MKKITFILFLGSFVFSAISFNQSTVFGGLDDEDGATVGHSFGVDFDVNETMSIGYDKAAGMMVKADAPINNLTFRIGYNTGEGESTYGLDYVWWTGGEGIQTSLSTVVDYTTAGSNQDETTVRINLNWGF